MSGFLTTLAITFCVILAFALFINFCRRRLRKTKHGLTGVCHKNGGPVCSSCEDTSHKNLSNP